MMIEDEEMRELFRIESEEHLQHLDDGLLRLEANPHDRPVLEEVFRGAHSLKGAARMLGVTDVETVAHCFEDVLGAAKRGEVPLSSDLFDGLYQGLDSIRKLVDEAITGTMAGVDVATFLDRFTRDSGQSHSSLDTSNHAQETLSVTEVALAKTSELAVKDEVPPVIETSGITPLQFPPQPSQQSSPRPSSHMNTIRVDSSKLDLLMTQAGELKVAKIRMDLYVEKVSQLVALWEVWNREVMQNMAAKNVVEQPTMLESNIAQEGTTQSEYVNQIGDLLESLAQATTEEHRHLETIAHALEEGIRMVRLLPLSTLFQLFRRLVRDIARDLGKEVDLVIKGGETTADKQIVEEMKDPLMHIIRNAIDHGIELPEDRVQRGKPRTGTVRLCAYQTATEVVIEIQDDGQGLNMDAIKRTALERQVCREEDLVAMTPAEIQSLVFASGFSTRDVVSGLSGRGVGMDVVRTHVEQLKGTIHLDSTPGKGCMTQIRLPMTIATTPVLLIAIHGYPYALPLFNVQVTCLIDPHDIDDLEGREMITLQGQSMAVVRLAGLLEINSPLPAQQALSASKNRAEAIPCVILTVGNEQVACLVEAFLDEQEIVMKPHNGILQRVRHVSGSTILSSGEVCIVLNPHDIINSARKMLGHRSAIENMPVTTRRKRRVLVVEDSLTIRTRVSRMLEHAGYVVASATDGLDALDQMQTAEFDVILSDVEMPRMDGLTLTRTIREQSGGHVPIVLFTSLSTETDKQHGMEAGATAYLSKATSSDAELLETIRGLI